ncbi:MAG: efflux RND transporter periplasmic adaptor subunit [Nostoc sp.]|uniref:efflux RND transporter periplasmic adaptor subunit n=1 Tax=Nostoc sp. TaxID=1180 RepID=UPI002FF4F1F3
MSDDSVSEVEVNKPVTSEDASFLSKSDQKPTRAWLKPLFLGAGLGIAIAFTGMGILSRLPSRQQGVVADKKVNPAMTVTIATVETARVFRTLKTTGTVAALDLIPVLPQTNGLQIKSIPEDVKEGAFVKQGQVLAVLDGSILQNQISQAKADMESKQADLAAKQADLGSNKAIVQQKQADLAQVKAKLEEAAKNYQRYQQLVDSGTISKQELDTRSYAVKTAIEVVNLSQENVRSAQSNIGSAQAIINKAKADVKSSAAKVQQLQTQLGQTVVRSPVAGVIAEKLARVGDVTGVPPQTQVGTVIGGTQKLFSIIRDEKLELQAKVPEIQLNQVKIGASVQITSDVDQRVRSQGRVREIQPQVNDQRREATVKIDLPSTTLLKPGMFASAAITTNLGMRMVVPQKAVQSQADSNVIVFTLSGEDTVRSQKVELGDPANDDKVEIKSGLQLGDRVVVDGAGYLKDGDKVRVAN